MKKFGREGKNGNNKKEKESSSWKKREKKKMRVNQMGANEERGKRSGEHFNGTSYTG